MGHRCRDRRCGHLGRAFLLASLEHDVDNQLHDGYAARRRRVAKQLDFHLENAAALARRLDRTELVGVVLFATQLAATSAPADRYFGRLKVSALRIRYETMQLKKRYETHELLPDQTLHLLLLNQDAFEQWAALYPKDPWLASTGYSMAQLFEELPGATARDHAVGLFVYVKSHFPNTSYARQSRDQLHRGVPIKPEPAWASAQRAVTPVPSQSIGPSATPAPAAAPSTTPAAAPEPSGTPATAQR